MAFAPYVYKRQPVLTRMFSLALAANHLGHAYLLTGEEGVPLKQTALFLAKSILCQHPNPLADETCLTCTRIDNGAYADFVFLDGDEDTVKKEAVAQIEDSFSKTALEKKGIMVYVINSVENMTAGAANAILKFLEEPNPDTYAILTTRNPAKVLPTIISRCQVFHLRLAPQNEVKQEAIALGVNEEDAELLSNFLNEANLIKDEAASPTYQFIRDAAVDFLSALTSSRQAARFAIEKASLNIKDKASLRKLFDFVCLFLSAALAYRDKANNPLPAYDKMIVGLANKLSSPSEKLLQAMTMRQEIESNINAGLLLIHLAECLGKE